MNTHNDTTVDTYDALGFSALTEEEQAETLRDIGDIVLKSALLRLVADMEAHDVQKLDDITAEANTQDELLEKIHETFPSFETLLAEEVTAFREETMHMGSSIKTE